MPAIYMKCPNTGQEVFTAQHATGPAMNSVINAGGRFRCAVCSQVHTWTEADAILGEIKVRFRKDGTISTARD